MELLIINGPSLKLLGSREPEIYGAMSYLNLIKTVGDYAKGKGVNCHFTQHSGEGEIIEDIINAFGAYRGIIINPGAYAHYSYAIRDAIKAVNIDAIEVHITNIFDRESFRARSVISPACIGMISGLGSEGYILAIEYFLLKGGLNEA